MDPFSHTIFVTLAGSHAQGTARESSDVDLRGVCVAPLDLRLSYRKSFEQTDATLTGELWSKVEARLRSHPTARRGLDRDVESVIYDIAKFIKLCATANPNTLEILFASQDDWAFSTHTWEKIHEKRKWFLSRKVQQTYLGYGMAQLKRIRNHRAWLLSPPAHKPTRGEYGLPETSLVSRDDRDRIEAAVAEKVRTWGMDEMDMPKTTRIALNERMERFWTDLLESEEDELDASRWKLAAKALQLTPETISTLTAEKRYQAALRNWQNYQKWQEQRNPARAELEAKFGYDTKHAMHLVRLMRTGLELLQTGDLRVRRPDADELRAIRDGRFSYDQLLDEAKRLEKLMHEASNHSELPPDADHQAIDALLVELTRI